MSVVDAFGRQAIERSCRTASPYLLIERCSSFGPGERRAQRQCVRTKVYLRRPFPDRPVMPAC